MAVSVFRSVDFHNIVRIGKIQSLFIRRTVLQIFSQIRGIVSLAAHLADVRIKNNAHCRQIIHIGHIFNRMLIFLIVANKRVSIVFQILRAESTFVYKISDLWRRGKSTAAFAVNRTLDFIFIVKGMPFGAGIFMLNKRCAALHLADKFVRQANHVDLPGQILVKIHGIDFSGCKQTANGIKDFFHSFSFSSI